VTARPRDQHIHGPGHPPGQQSIKYGH
jgi:hypothetical protein